MRKTIRLLWLTTLILSGCSPSNVTRYAGSGVAPLAYVVNLNDRDDDLFKVMLKVDDLKAENAIYQFASTAPGTYQVMDIGRFVREFQAFDAAGNALSTAQISTNQWQIQQPEAVREIRYTIAETWDTPVDSNQIYPMAGTSIEADHVQLLGHCVFGYPTGMQARPLVIKLDYPQDWTVGTALSRDRNGHFAADNYDHIVDSPILLGRLSKADLQVNGSKIEIYTYSKTDQVKSEQILESIEDILLSAADFMDGLPVERYTFLFHFEDISIGAWEHSYSSNYVYSEAQFDKLIGQNIPAVVAHEFFHVITPLNIHSEIIEQFNFVQPVASEHLWLYESTTEWTAHMMQLRSGLIDLDTYLKRLSIKLKVAEHFRQDYSLRDLALESFTREGAREYANIYMKGAVVAGLLDIRLLELSGGKKGLREVINELSKMYGPDKAFPEDGFYDIFTEITFPEIAAFLENYVRNAEPLPLAEIYSKIGIKYTPEVHIGEETASAGFTVIVPAGKILLSQVAPEIRKLGPRDGDMLLAYNGEKVTLQNLHPMLSELKEKEAGQPYELVVEREGEQMTFHLEKISIEKVKKHVFEVDPDATREQVRLRQAWMRNL